MLDTHLSLPARSRLVTSARDVPTLVLAGADAPEEAARRLADFGVTIERIGLDADGRIDLSEALRALSRRGVTRVFSEGGPRVAARLLALGLADEVALITAEKPLGRPGVPALGLRRAPRSWTRRAIGSMRPWSTALMRCGSGSELN